MKLSLRKNPNGSLSHPKLNDESLNVQQGVRLEKLTRHHHNDPKYKLVVDEGTDSEYTIFANRLMYRQRVGTVRATAINAPYELIDANAPEW